MRDFIANATKEFGIDEDAARSAAGGVLDIVRAQADPGEVGALMDQLPQLRQLSSPDDSGRGALGTVGGLLGGQAGVMASLSGVFDKAGLSLDDAGGFVSMLFGWIRSKVGGDLVGRLLQSVPQIKSLVG